MLAQICNASCISIVRWRMIAESELQLWRGILELETGETRRNIFHQ